MEMPANRIEALREGAKKSRVELAVHCEVGEATIRRWERGETAIPDEQKFRLADLFEVTPSYLMGWSGDRETVSSGEVA
jgi:transcriptional regulator with XRE-family HTH domain